MNSSLKRKCRPLVISLRLYPVCSIFLLCFHLMVNTLCREVRVLRVHHAWSDVVVLVAIDCTADAWTSSAADGIFFLLTASMLKLLHLLLVGVKVVRCSVTTNLGTLNVRYLLRTLPLLFSAVKCAWSCELILSGPARLLRWLKLVSVNCFWPSPWRY